MHDQYVQVLETQAKSVLPAEVFDYFAGGAGAEETLRANVAAWSDLAFRPRVLRSVAEVALGTELFGSAFPTPLFVAPMAFHSLAHADGERATATGSTDRATFVLSTRASQPIEAIAQELPQPWWFQVYVLRDRGLTQELVRRAVAAGASALVLTGDTPVVGRKRRDRGSFAIPDEMFFANLPAGTPLEACEQSESVTFDAIAWLAEQSGLPVIVKGVLRADDASACVRAGASAVVVSNHGGRQLDGAIATAAALPAVVDAVAATVPVLVDGGVRNGRDVARALALGASSVGIGRPVLWALATGGAAGVARYLDWLVDDLRHTMQLLGAASIGDLSPDLLAS